MLRRRVETTLGGLLLVVAVAFQPGAAAAEQQEDPEDPAREPTDPITLTSGAAESTVETVCSHCHGSEHRHQSDIFGAGGQDFSSYPSQPASVATAHPPTGTSLA